jgi:IS5 family transposase
VQDSSSALINKNVMTKTHYLTAEGLEKLKEELHRLTSVEREAAARAIAEPGTRETCPRMPSMMRQKTHRDCWS